MRFIGGSYFGRFCGWFVFILDIFATCDDDHDILFLYCRWPFMWERNSCGIVEEAEEREVL